MRRNENQKYTLENKLRTWSQLKAEQEALLAANPGGGGLLGGMSRRGSYQRRLSMDRRKSFTNDGNNTAAATTSSTIPSTGITQHPLSQSTLAATTTSEPTDNHRTVDENDKHSIEKAVNNNVDKQNMKTPALKVVTPEGKDTKDLTTNGTKVGNQSTSNNTVGIKNQDELDDEEEEDFSHLDRGRDGGGSYSGFNSSDAEDEEDGEGMGGGENAGIDSDHENQMEACMVRQLKRVRAERLGDIQQESDSENDAFAATTGPGALTPVLEKLKMED